MDLDGGIGMGWMKDDEGGRDGGEGSRVAGSKVVSSGSGSE